MRYKLWNIVKVLQNEDERRLLDSADTKYDVLITHIWVLKTAQNDNFVALFTNKLTSLKFSWWAP